jgi:competence protein ComEC
MTSLDLRLLPVAVALWAGSAIGLHTALRPTFFLLSVVVGSLLIAAALRRHVASPWAGALLVGLLLAAIRADAASPSVIAAAMEDAGIVRFSAVIDSEPERVEQRGFGGLSVEWVILAHATLVGIETHDSRWATSLPVMLQWSPDGMVHAVGERVSGVAIPSRADVASRNAFWIRVQGRLRVDARESRGAWLASRVRHGLARATDAGRAGDGAALLPGLVLGDTRAQSPQLVDDLRVSGLSHLTAVSGANLAIVLGAVLWALRRTRIRAMHRHAILIATIPAFVVVVQPQPSVIRAAMMGAISVFALVSGERRASASTLWLSIVVLLLVDPFLAWQWGFALSVAATAGLILIGPWLAAQFSDRRLGTVLAVTLSAQLATFPILLAMGRPPSWLSIPANVLCEPLVAPATVSGFLAAIVAALAIIPNPALAEAALAIASLLAWPGIRLADAIAWIAHRGAATPLAVAPIGSFAALVAVIAMVAILYRLGLRRRALVVCLCIAVTASACFPDGLRRWPPSDWWYAMCDVGQGDSSVVNLGGGAVIVIDAGPDPIAERRCLRRLGVREISALFITHFHADHVEGVSGALQQAAIHRLFSTAVREPLSEWHRVRMQLGRVPDELAAGDVVRFGATTVRVLWPVTGATTGDPNNGSLVLDIERDGVHLLVTGDADAAAQASLHLPTPAYAVLKVPHHGSRFHDPGFVRRVHPVLALVSVGAGNDYGHPAQATIAAYRAQGVRVLRTDLIGNIAVSVHGEQVSFSALSG